MIVPFQEIVFSRTQSHHEEIVDRYLKKTGWKFHLRVKIRGMRPDFVVSKNEKIAMIKVKGEKANMDNAIKQVLHLKNAANYAYLALPDKIITREKIQICRDLGIGLFSINDEAQEIVKPEFTQGLKSVEKKILQTKNEKPKTVKKSLLELLFRSRTLIAVLKILFLNQTKEYPLHELSRKAGVAPSTALREMRRMEPLDIITKTKRDHIVYYAINKHGIIHNELKKIFLKFELAAKIISNELEKYELKYALLYGSFARGTETESSDMDVLIVGNVEGDIIARSMFDLSTEIGREINHILWTEKEFQEKIAQKISLLHNIRNDEIIMIKGDEDEFKKSVK